MTNSYQRFSAKPQVSGHRAVMFHNITHLRRIQVVALVTWGIFFLASTIWMAVRSEHQRRLEGLMYSARTGDSASLAELAADSSSFSEDLLLQIAQSGANSVEIRRAALNGLDDRKHIDSSAIAVLLSIDEPFALRHQAADIVRRHGCDNSCVSAALYSLKSLLEGSPTEEMRKASRVQQVPNNDLTPILQKLKQQSIDDYFSLLQLDPCLTRKVLSDDYPGKHDQSLSAILQRIRACSK